MRVLVAYPPMESAKGSPMLTQNRQFQWFNEPSYLYPCVPASAATLLQSKGHNVRWVDCIAEHRDAEQFRALGFTKVFNVTGGINAWSEDVDNGVPKY